MKSVILVGVVGLSASASLADPALNPCGVDRTGLSETCIVFVDAACTDLGVEIAACSALLPNFFAFAACVNVAQQLYIDELNFILASTACSNPDPADPIPFPGMSAPAYRNAVAINMANPVLFRGLDLWRQ